LQLNSKFCTFKPDSKSTLQVVHLLKSDAVVKTHSALGLAVIGLQLMWLAKI